MAVKDLLKFAMADMRRGFSARMCIFVEGSLRYLPYSILGTADIVHPMTILDHLCHNTAFDEDHDRAWPLSSLTLRMTVAVMKSNKKGVVFSNGEICIMFSPL